MSAHVSSLLGRLEEIPSPFVEPRIAYQTNEPRKASNLTLIEGKTFLSTSVAGDIMPPGAPDVGFFHDDTRFLSHLELRVGGQLPVTLSSSTEKSFAAQVELTTGTITLRETFDLPESTIHIRREQLLSRNVFCDNITFENFNQNSIEFLVELTYAADFFDVFQVRGTARGKSGHYFRPVVEKESVAFHYLGLDELSRTTFVRFSPAPVAVSDGVIPTASWMIRLESMQRVRIDTSVSAIVERDPQPTTRLLGFGPNLQLRRQKFGEWQQQSTSFRSSHEELDRALRTAVGDFHALQIPHGDEHIIAAGIPWFATMFGRDSLIAAFQSLVLNPKLAADTLRILARYQGKRADDWRDEDPGKILHEQRDGEMTNSGEMPFSPYYGSVDATPLFLVLMGEYFSWTADEHLVRELLPAIHGALNWIERYGDLDGDGFIEYKRRSPRGLTNQGWKDSWDANMHADGTIADAPIALVEVQGYVYDAKYRMSRLLRHVGDAPRADRLKQEATEMLRRIERAFWLPGKRYFAMALDAKKKKLEPVSSNPGHLLFSRALRTERARAVIHRLMQPDMHSGWGWRTLSASERVFNPMSYHRGSVWPHDNSLIAHGMCLYDTPKPAIHTLTTLFHTALNYRENRLPELFCGMQRREHDAPVHYPVSCSPQAWASGAFFLMLTSILGIRPSASEKELNIVNPTLPEWLDFMEIRNMSVGRSRIDLDFTRRGNRTFCNVVDVRGEHLVVNITFKKNYA